MAFENELKKKIEYDRNVLFTALRLRNKGILSYQISYLVNIVTYRGRVIALDYDMHT